MQATITTTTTATTLKQLRTLFKNQPNIENNKRVKEREEQLQFASNQNEQTLMKGMGEQLK